MFGPIRVLDPHKRGFFNGRLARVSIPYLISKGCVLYLSGDAKVGNKILDRSPYGNNGAIMGALPQILGRKKLVKWRGQLVDIGGSVLSFDGVDDYVDITDFSLGGEVTALGWVYPTAHQSWQRLLDFGNGAGANNFLVVASRETTGNPAFHIYIGDVPYNANSPDPISLNTWHFLVGVLGGGRVKLYVNSVLKADVAGPPGLNTLTRVNSWIGRSNWVGDAYFKGMIDEVCIYNRALSAEEIRYYYNLLKRIYV